MAHTTIFRTKYRAAYLTSIGFLLFSFACSAAPNSTATSTAKPADTATATHTLAPTATNEPTTTPTSTATPAPTPMLDSATGHVVRSEHFDSLSTLSFGMYGVGTSEVIDGHLVLTEKFSSNPTADGEAAGRSTFSPQPGNISVFLFKAEENAYFGYHFELYEQTDAGEQYTGINLQQQGAGLQLNFWKGKSGSQKLQLSLPVSKFRYDTWYYYSLLVHLDGSVTAQLWERDQPANMIFDRTIQLDPEWAKPGFTFVVTAYQGTMQIDEYQEIELAAGAVTTPDAKANQCTTAPAGLIGWWPGEGNAQDLVAGNNGVLNGGSGFASGKVGQAFSFNGVNGSVNIPRTPSLDVGQQVSVEFWMKPAPGNPMHKCCQGLVGTDYYLVEILDWTSSVSGVSIDINTGGGFKHTAEDLNANYQTPVDQWSFIVGTYDGIHLNLYVNGKLEAQVLHEGTIIPMELTSFLSLGSEDGRTTCPGCVKTRYFNGLIDEVSVYNRALTKAEIQSIYAADSAGKCTLSP